MRRLWRRGASYQVLQRLDVNNSSDLSLVELGREFRGNRCHAPWFVEKNRDKCHVSPPPRSVGPSLSPLEGTPTATLAGNELPN